MTQTTRKQCLPSPRWGQRGRRSNKHQERICFSGKILIITHLYQIYYHLRARRCVTYIPIWNNRHQERICISGKILIITRLLVIYRIYNHRPLTKLLIVGPCSELKLFQTAFTTQAQLLKIDISSLLTYIHIHPSHFISNIDRFYITNLYIHIHISVCDKAHHWPPPNSSWQSKYKWTYCCFSSASSNCNRGSYDIYSICILVVTIHLVMLIWHTFGPKSFLFGTAQFSIWTRRCS